MVLKHLADHLAHSTLRDRMVVQGALKCLLVFFRWQIFPITWNSWKSSLAVSVWIGVRLTEWRWRCRPADTGQFLGPLILPVFSGLATIHADGPWQMLLSAKVVQLCLPACIAEQTGEKQEVCNCGRHSHWCVLGPGLMGHFAHDTISLFILFTFLRHSQMYSGRVHPFTSGASVSLSSLYRCCSRNSWKLRTWSAASLFVVFF